MFAGMLIGNETWPRLMAGLCRRRAGSLVCLCLALEPMIKEVGSLAQGKKASDLLVPSLNVAQLLQAGMLLMGENRLATSRRT